MIFALIYLGLEYLTPYLKQSPVFNGVMSVAGVVLLLILPLLSLVERRPIGPGEWFQLVLGIFGCTLMGLGMVLYGLSFWFHGLEAVALVLLGLCAVISTVYIILLLRADKKHSSKKDILST
jgi:hypothetical protein